MDKSWIAPVLEQHLRPVAAPRELWDRVREPRRAGVFPAWKLAFASVLVIATAWALHPRTSIESESPSQIREWVKARTGLDVPLAPSSAVRMCGAKIAGSSAEIRFRVADRETTVQVARAERVAAVHEFRGSTFVWRGEAFTASDSGAACLLCHADVLN